MKIVFSNHYELAHIWAQQRQEAGKASSMFFEGKSIYSYGYHFEIARFINDNTVLFTNREYSNSTSKHKSVVRSSISHKNIIYCYDIESLSNNIIQSRYNIEQNLIKSISARSRKDTYIANALSIGKNLDDYINVTKYRFNKDDRKSYKFIKNLLADIPNAQNILKNEAEKEKNRIKKRNALLQKEFEKKLSNWKNGEGEIYLSSHEVYLRIKGDFVETTKGARVKIASAKFLADKIINKMPVHGLLIDDYTVVSYTDGILKIGCHNINQSEIDRFLPLLMGVK